MNEEVFFFFYKKNTRNYTECVSFFRTIFSLLTISTSISSLIHGNQTTMRSHFQLQQDDGDRGGKRSITKQIQPFVAAGMSACTASAVVHPIDLAKVRMQLFKTQHPGVAIPTFPGMLSKMVKTEGISSIYSGLSAAMMRQAVYGTARIGLHRSFSDQLQERNKGEPLSFAMKTGAGMLSGAIAVCLGCPFDVTLVRMQADSMKPMAERRNYKGVGDALLRVVKEEGIAKLYSGLAPNVLRGMSNNAGMMACFDQSKEFFGGIFQDPKGKPSQKTQIAASFVAGFTASFCALPFDLVKSRMQDGGKSRYKGVVDAMFSIYRTEGILSFWTGFGAYYMRTAPHAMIVLMVMQPITDTYKKYLL